MEFLLKCPTCSLPLTQENGSYRCPQGHTFDVARSGYVNLLLCTQRKSDEPGDNKDSLSARRTVLAHGYYAPLFEAVTTHLFTVNKDFGVILDAGCGEGYFTRSLASAYPKAQILGVDISKYGVDSAAKACKRAKYLVASTKNLPIFDDSLDVLFCAFAPLFAEEAARVLKSGGYLVQIVPAERHLWELKQLMYASPVENAADFEVPQGFELAEQARIAYPFRAEGEVFADLVKMTPYYYKTPREGLQNALAAGELTIGLDFYLRVFRKL